MTAPGPPRQRRLGPVLLLAAIAVATAGCGTGRSEAAGAAAESFAAALRGGQPAAACARLAPDTRDRLERDTEQPCEQALLDLDLDGIAERAGSVEVFGEQALVRVGTDAVFLARFADGWRVTAAGCTPRPGRPYECRLEA